MNAFRLMANYRENLATGLWSRGAWTNVGGRLAADIAWREAVWVEELRPSQHPSALEAR